MRPGPDHYTRLDPEPIDVIRAWDLPWCIGNVVKYCARYRNKGGIEDLEKARHYLDEEIKAMEKQGGDDAMPRPDPIDTPPQPTLKEWLDASARAREALAEQWARWILVPCPIIGCGDFYEPGAMECRSGHIISVAPKNPDHTCWEPIEKHLDSMTRKGFGPPINNCTVAEDSRRTVCGALSRGGVACLQRPDHEGPCDWF